MSSNSIFTPKFVSLNLAVKNCDERIASILETKETIKMTSEVVSLVLEGLNYKNELRLLNADNCLKLVKYEKHIYLSNLVLSNYFLQGEQTDLERLLEAVKFTYNKYFESIGVSVEIGEEMEKEGLVSREENIDFVIHSSLQLEYIKRICDVLTGEIEEAIEAEKKKDLEKELLKREPLLTDEQLLAELGGGEQTKQKKETEKQRKARETREANKALEDEEWERVAFYARSGMAIDKKLAKKYEKRLKTYLKTLTAKK